MTPKSEKVKQRRHKFTSLSSAQLSLIINEWILDERHRLICHLKFIDNRTYECIAEDERINLTDRQVKNIVRKCSGVIQSHIEDYVVGVKWTDLLPK